MSQKYSGDITIIPEVGYGDFLKVLSNPSFSTVMEAINRGERATWPSNDALFFVVLTLFLKSFVLTIILMFPTEMSIIRNHLQIELTIDAILYRLRLRRLSELPYNSNINTNSNAPTSRPVMETRAASHLDIPRVSTLPPTTEFYATQSTPLSYISDREKASTRRELTMTAPDKS